MFRNSRNWIDRTDMIREQGFLLTVESLDIKGQCELHFYGTGSRGPFKIIYNNHKPLFFINRDAAPLLSERVERKEVKLVDFHEMPVDALYFPSLDSFFNSRKMLKDQHIKLFESDVRAEDRFLMERHIKGSLEIEGEAENEGPLRVFRNPRIRPVDYRPRLTWLSFDIETGQDGTLYSVSFHLTGNDQDLRKVIMRGIDPGSSPLWMEYCPGEKELLERFVSLVREYDPDLLIGWHVIGFDLKFLNERALKLGVRLNLGRGFRELRLIEKRNGLFAADLEGRIVVDGPQTLRTAFYKFENFKLETVAQELIGRGKDITPEKDKVAEIERRFREDKEALGFYNLEDSVLVTEIFRETAIIDQLVTRSLITGLPVDKVHMSVAAFDYFMLPLIHRKGYVAPDTADMEPGAHAAGGHVFSSDAGLYPHVVVLDFKSLYPTIIRTFFIDPLSRLKNETDPCTTPVGISFSRTHHILPDFLTELMGRRAAAKKEGDQYLAQAVKILMNSFYGVMGTTGCRFYHADLPTAITGTGQWILKSCASRLREKGYQVIYGDTDSVFVCLKEEEYANPGAAGERLEKEVNNYFSKKLKEDFHIESRLEIEFEKHYTKFFLPPMRNSQEGARKRYSGLLDNGEMEFKGLETVRSDWTAMARDFQQELFSRFFHEKELKQWVRDYVQKLRDGEFDSKLIYKKRLSRQAGDYTKSRPPHVKAALLLDPEGTRKLREISYIITAEGPVPVEMYEGGADYSHYVEKQIKPIADAVLFAIGEDFDSLIEGRQLNLF
ncbi:DNA polymerase II [Spirochaeta isovalerica]|uniref:DNA polymerase n=1 Tax=Spirochaeta isovalerica TaxID=150 RepID=A0A841RF49_9SPIO|nr:DNA polymerase II [Spirochaeta isovalerica]MBB6481449.1 DNA polymerase-2 [Spirochaeta isovalerica]